MKTSMNAERVYETVKGRIEITDKDFCIEAFRTAQIVLAEIPVHRRPALESRIAKLLAAGISPENAYVHLKRDCSYEADRKLCLRILRTNQRLLKFTQAAA